MGEKTYDDCFDHREHDHVNVSRFVNQGSLITVHTETFGCSLARRGKLTATAHRIVWICHTVESGAFGTKEDPS